MTLKLSQLQGFNIAGNRWSLLSDFGGAVDGQAIVVNGLNIIVGCTDGTLRQSTDGGKTWTSRSVSGGYSSIDNLEFGNGVYLALSKNHTRVARSTDGATWNLATTVLSGTWETVFAEGKFLVTAEGGFDVYSSTDADTFTSVLNTSPDPVYGVAHDGDDFVVFSYAGSPTYYTSPSGNSSSWTNRTGVGSDPQAYAAGGDNFLAVLTQDAFGDDNIYTANALAGPWTLRHTFAVLSRLRYGDGYFISMQGGGSPGLVVSHTDDLSSWQLRDDIPVLTDIKHVGNGFFYGVVGTQIWRGRFD